jgi:hypothetical protein
MWLLNGVVCNQILKQIDVTNLRKIFYPLRTGENTRRIPSNPELDRLINGKDIVRFIKTRGIRWLCHVQRNDSSRVAKRM